MNNDKEKLLKQLKSLKNIPNFKEVQALRKRLQKEISKFDSIPKSISKTTAISKETIKQNANKNRSSSMKRNWRF